jgi:anthranilate/para-aminobenzoate synthase component I
MVRGEAAMVRAGAGVMADSIPEREEEETRGKARAMPLAVDMSHKANGR